jgi:hypothetical protein
MKTRVYKSEKGSLTLAVYAGVILFLLGIILVKWESILTRPILIILLLPVAFLAWIWMDTWYRIEGNDLHYRSGPFRGKIDITSIHEIIRDQTLWVGFKPALGQKGLIIKYKKWDEIYISPAGKDAFLNELLEKNRSIRVKE